MNLARNEPCPNCGRFANRGLSIDAVIVKDGKILLIKRGADPFKGYWGLIGGYVEWDESAEQTVRREVKEEVGCDITSISFVGVYSDPARHPKQVVDLAYKIEITGEPKAGDDATEAKWFDLGDLPSELAIDHKQIIADALK